MQKRLFITLSILIVSAAASAFPFLWQDHTVPMDWSWVFNRQTFFTVALGAVSGYVASKILGGEGFGFFGNIVVGVIGGLIGSWLIKIAKIPMLNGFFGTLISSVGGAIILIFFIEIVKYLQKANKSTSSTRRRK
jgi:uncharacterized membrane protein YeaQ/YmgE (transglycosylase-associated protein family)